MNQILLALEDDPGRPISSLADAVEAATERALFGSTRLRDVRSAVDRTARMLGRPATELPANPEALRPLLMTILPARHGISRKSLANIRADISSLLAALDLADRLGRTDVDLWPAWGRLVDSVSLSVQRASLRAFARWAQGEGYGPSEIDEAVIEAFRTWRRTRTLDLHVNTTVGTVRRIWNNGVRTVPGWPQRRLAAPKDPRALALPRARFTPAFLADLDAYVAALSHPDPLRHGFGRRWSPLTVRDRSRALLRMASILVAQGRDIATILSVADLVTEPSMRTALLHLYERGGGPQKGWPSGAVTFACTVMHVAEAWCGVKGDDLEKLRALRKLVRPERKGLSRRNLDRLEQFDEPALLRRFLELPDELMRAADRLKTEGCHVRAAEMHETGLALALLMLNPMRRQNLVELDVQMHFRRDHRGNFLAISIPGTAVKNGVGIEAELPRELARRLALHLREHHPRRSKLETSCLFPSRKGGPRAAEVLARAIKRAVGRYVGAQFNVHAQRHLAVKLLLDDSTDNIPVAQRLLGHRDAKTTVAMYGTITTRAAQKSWNESIQRRLR